MLLSHPPAKYAEGWATERNPDGSGDKAQSRRSERMLLALDRQETLRMGRLRTGFADLAGVDALVPSLTLLGAGS